MFWSANSLICYRGELPPYKDSCTLIVHIVLCLKLTVITFSKLIHPFSVEKKYKNTYLHIINRYGWTIWTRKSHTSFHCFMNSISSVVCLYTRLWDIPSVEEWQQSFHIGLPTCSLLQTVCLSEKTGPLDSSIVFLVIYLHIWSVLLTHNHSSIS